MRVRNASITLSSKSLWKKRKKKNTRSVRILLARGTQQCDLGSKQCCKHTTKATTTLTVGAVADCERRRSGACRARAQRTLCCRCRLGARHEARKCLHVRAPRYRAITVFRLGVRREICPPYSKKNALQSPAYATLGQAKMEKKCSRAE